MSFITDRAVTVFPHPDSPTTPSVSPLSMCRSMPSTARTTPSSVKKCVFRPLISSNRSAMSSTWQQPAAGVRVTRRIVPSSMRGSGAAGSLPFPCPARPLAGGELVDQALQDGRGLVRAAQADQRVGLLVEGFGRGLRPAVGRDHRVVARQRGFILALANVERGDPQFFLGQPEASRLDLHYG